MGTCWIRPVARHGVNELGVPHMHDSDSSGWLCRAPLPIASIVVPGSLLLLLVVGCGSGPASLPTAAVRDSAGVTIVENQEGIPPDGGGWSLAASPSLVIGGLDGPEDSGLYRVRGAARLPDGRIAVANDGSLEVKIFGVDGAQLASLGGEGQGPGEFNSVTLTGRLGDTLVALDRRLRRVSLVHPDEGFVRSFTIAEPVTEFPLGGWFFESGSVLIEDLSLSADGGFEDGFGRRPARLKSCDLTGALHSDFGELPGSEEFTITRQGEHGTAIGISSVPFGKSPQVAVAGDRLFFGSQDSYEISVFDSRAALRTLVRLARSPVRVTDSDLAAYISAELEGSDEEKARAERERFEQMPMMEFRPAHGAISADREGFLFVEEFRAPGMESIPVNVFDPDGRLVGRFEISADTEILEIGPGYLLALYEDSMDVEFVHLYELTRPG